MDIDLDSPPPIKDFIVVCMIEGCSNCDIQLYIKAFGDDPSVVCGVCNSPITEVIFTEPSDILVPEPIEIIDPLNDLTEIGAPGL